MTLKERAEIVEKLVTSSFCTHFPGYLCDRDWPEACTKCITSWIIRNGITERGFFNGWKI